MTTITIRPYRGTDRDAVRDICFKTGYMGKPIRPQWADQPSFATLFSAYYTDREPESALVADREGVVVGYLLGCRDTKHAPNTTRIFLTQLLTRCLIIRPGTARFVRHALTDSVADLVRRQTPPDRFVDPRWPAHLHVNLLTEARGQGVGTELVRQWLLHLDEEGAAGCHLETLAENSGAIAFFTSCGFERLDEPKPAPGFRSPDGARHHVQVMVRPPEPEVVSG